MAREKLYPSKQDIRLMERHFLSGETLADVKRRFAEADWPACRVTEARHNLFKRLNSSPSNVKALANGPILNANNIIRYSGRRKPKAVQPVQEVLL